MKVHNFIYSRYLDFKDKFYGKKTNFNTFANLGKCIIFQVPGASSVLSWRMPMDRGAWGAVWSPWGLKESDTTEHLNTHT